MRNLLLECNSETDELMQEAKMREFQFVIVGVITSLLILERKN